MPWSHFSPPDKSGWPTATLGFLLAILLASGGFFLLDEPARLPPVATSPPFVTPSSAVTSDEPVLLSEQDLQPVDLSGATSTAEEFVIDYFTRSGDNPTYVEWARSTKTGGQVEELVVSVRYRILVGDPYVRMPVRESVVTLRFIDGGWLVVGLPSDSEALPIQHENDSSDFDVNEYGFRIGRSP